MFFFPSDGEIKLFPKSEVIIVINLSMCFLLSLLFVLFCFYFGIVSFDTFEHVWSFRIKECWKQSLMHECSENVEDQNVKKIVLQVETELTGCKKIKDSLENFIRGCSCYTLTKHLFMFCPCPKKKKNDWNWLQNLLAHSFVMGNLKTVQVL